MKNQELIVELKTLRTLLKQEISGIKHPGESAYAILIKEHKFTGTRNAILAALNERIFNLQQMELDLEDKQTT